MSWALKSFFLRSQPNGEASNAGHVQSPIGYSASARRASSGASHSFSSAFPSPTQTLHANCTRKAATGGLLRSTGIRFPREHFRRLELHGDTRSQLRHRLFRSSSLMARSTGVHMRRIRHFLLSTVAGSQSRPEACCHTILRIRSPIQIFRKSIRIFVTACFPATLIIQTTTLIYNSSGPRSRPRSSRARKSYSSDTRFRRTTLTPETPCASCALRRRSKSTIHANRPSPHFKLNTRMPSWKGQDFAAHHTARRRRPNFVAPPDANRRAAAVRELTVSRCRSAR